MGLEEGGGEKELLLQEAMSIVAKEGRGAQAAQGEGGHFIGIRKTKELIRR